MESMVKNTLIILDERRIGSILEMPTSSICVHRLEKIDGLKCILERKYVNEMTNLIANQSSIEMRLLHNIMSVHDILPQN